MNCAVFNAEARKAVSIIRSLGRAGFSIVTFSFERISFAGSSRYVKRNYYIQRFDKEFIHTKLRDHEIDVVFPIEDDSIEFFGKNRTGFENYILIIPDYETFILFADKANTVRHARERGVSVPDTYIPESLEDAQDYFTRLREYPRVIKPRRSTGSIGLKVVHGSEDGIESYREISKRFHLPIIQEYIPSGGRAVGAEFLCYRGREIMSFSHQRIREFPVRSGPSTFCKYYRQNDAIVEGRKLLEGLDYSGFAMVEFREHPERRRLYLMEINPRPWGSITLPISMGFDFPAEAVKLFSDPAGYEPPECRTHIETGKEYYMRWLLPGDFLSIMLDGRMSVGEKLGQLFGRRPNTAYQILSITDPFPAIVMIVKLVLNLFNIGYIRKYLLRRW
ncbi:MAG: ATP-grasp domain-containing protein [bacterium]|nr:MAG: ATP-grasp domain-containing protein [bacterium]